MIELVIKIPEKAYNALTHSEFDANLVVDEMRKAIANGIPLPEHHGRLIDADDLYEKSRLCHTEEDGTACVEWREINDAPTIIEAEGSDSE
jgi:hypothetical protein